MQPSASPRRPDHTMSAAAVSDRTHKFRRFAEIGLPATGVAIGMLLVIGPFLATVIRSLLYFDRQGGGVSLQNFAGLFSDPRFYQAVGNTLIAGAGATIISTLLGFSLAWVVSRTDMP